MKTERKSAVILMSIYLILLTWIILFKMRTSLEDLGELRSFNLVPYGASAFVNGRLDLSEMIYNIAAFIPVGIYVSMLWPRWRFIYKCLPAAGISLIYEIFQYILGIGATDITDWIHNTLGGIAGVLLYLTAYRVCQRYTNRIVLVFAGLCTAFLLILLFLLVFLN